MLGFGFRGCENVTRVGLGDCCSKGFSLLRGKLEGRRFVLQIQPNSLSNEPLQADALQCCGLLGFGI